MGIVDGLDAAARGDVVFGRGEFEHGIVAQRSRRLHESLAETALADQHRAVEVLQRPGDDLRRRCRTAVDQHRQRQVCKDRLRVGAEHLLRIFRTPLGADHLGPFGDEHSQDFDRLLHDAAAVGAVVEHKPFQRLFGAQPFDGRAHLLVASFGEVAVADVADAVGDPSGVGHARNRDPFAADRRRLLRAVEVLDGHFDLAARLALETRGDQLGREAFGVLAVDREDFVADLQPGLSAGDPW